MAELWYAGDKVKLTGSGWRGEIGSLNVGDIVTLDHAVSPGVWAIREGRKGDQFLHVWSDMKDIFAAEKVYDIDHQNPSDPFWESPKAEVRTTSSTGGEKGVKPEEYALIPWEAMDEIARVYAFGAQKYAAHNWRKGYEWGKSFSALCRHIFAFWKGEDRDPESNLSHLAHAGFHVLSLLTFWLQREKYGEHDDRYRADGS